MELNTRKLNIEYALIQIFYWMGFCICVNFAAVFLLGRGYSNSSLGLILALGNVAGFLLSPYLAQLVDGARLNVYHCLLLLMMVQLLVLASFVFIPGKRLLISLLYCIYIACNSAVNAMNTQLSFVLDGWSGQINYGLARGLGCLGYTPMAILLAYLAGRYSSNISPYAGLLVISIQLIILLIVRSGMSDTSARKAPSNASSGRDASSALAFLRINPGFCIILVGLCCLYFTHSLSTSFMINVVRNIGRDVELSGAISGFMAIVELPTMLLYSRVAKRISCKAMLCFASIMFVVKAFLISMASNSSELYLAASVHSLSYALLTPAIVQYVSTIVRKADSAKAQALAFAMSSLGYAFACGVGGVLYDHVSVRATLLTGLAICTLGAVLLVLSTSLPTKHG